MISIKNIVIPGSYSDISLFLKHLKFYKKYLNYSNIVLIAPSNASTLLSNDTSFSFIPEESILSKNTINEYLLKMRAVTTKRNGWYLQQFIKMAYARICKKKYYLIYDIDTIPIKQIKMFENNKPYFDMKIGHDSLYFETMNLLIPKLRFSNWCYVTEHMLIKTVLMKNLLDAIEINYKLPGKFFWEKILMAIDLKYMNGNGFSEYETYGCYVDTKYPNIYIHREWHSKRNAKSYFGSSDNLKEEYINWLSQYYNALTFERYHIFDEEYFEIIKEKKKKKKYNPKKFFEKFNYFHLL